MIHFFILPPIISLVPLATALETSAVKPTSRETSTAPSASKSTAAKSSAKSPSWRSIVCNSVARQCYILLHLATKTTSSKLSSLSKTWIQVDFQVLAI